MDQSSFAAPHGFSQRITSFFACACQGIHQMPLRHLIVLIANAHHLAIPTGMAAATTFYNRAHSTMPSTCSIRSLNWSYAEQLACAGSLRPASRDQIRYRAVRQRQSSHPSEACPKTCQQRTTLRTGFLPASGPSFASGRLDHPRRHWNRLRTSRDKTQNTWKPPDQSSLHDVYRTGIDLIEAMQTFISSEDNFVLTRRRRSAGAPNDWRRALRCMAAMLKLEQGRHSIRTKHGGAERDRTADPLLAKQVLSQLSYSPNPIGNSPRRQ